jgi:transcriptional regulator GlxA family with amidase domain
LTETVLSNVTSWILGLELTTHRAREELRRRKRHDLHQHRQSQIESVIDWIAARARTAALTASVCTGAFLLARAGLLDGRRVTTHWEDVGDLRRMFPALKVEEGPRWIDEGAIVTSAGISAGIDMSLHLVERRGGEALALRTARQMDYDWRRS